MKQDESAWQCTNMQVKIEPQLDTEGHEVPGLGSSTLTAQLMSDGAAYTIIVAADKIMSNHNIVNALRALQNYVVVATGGKQLPGVRIAGRGEMGEKLNG